ncbi:glycosyltransferase family 4 protein [Flavobacterium sp. ARAG 55.4]|uniref:glycosyltransferase family 4 protein n=1 Tax=Flavobacterium sp. ARAG 55.4 TaxID=3451357 RepID=UPI003F4688C4
MHNYKQGINIIGYTKGSFGLGEAVRLNIKAAKKHNIPLSLIDYNEVKNNPKYQYSFEYPVNLVQISLQDLKSFFGVINPDLFKEKYTILFLVWESEYIAPELLENLNLFNEIWTTSHYCKSIFQKTYNNPIIIVPHPVEVALDTADKKNTIAFFDEKKFSFLFIFSYHSSIERKNPFFLIEAFKTAFGNNANVELVIKTVGGDHYRKSRQQLQKYISNTKNIKIFDIELDKNNVNQLINNCNAYVSMHHSEGFGLTLAEAMFLGKPTIATNYSGNTEFMNDNNSYLIDFQVGYIENPDKNFCAKTIWANPKLSSAVDKLIEVYENPSLRNSKANHASLYIKEKLSFYAIGMLIKERLNYLYANFENVTAGQNQNAYFINQLQLAKTENTQLQKEIRRMKKNIIIRFVLFLKNSIRKIKLSIKNSSVKKKEYKMPELIFQNSITSNQNKKDRKEVA